MGNFIQTKDAETADKLRSLGFPEIKNTNGMFTFVNCGALTFADSNVDPDKIHYTNAYVAS